MLYINAPTAEMGESVVGHYHLYNPYINKGFFRNHGNIHPAPLLQLRFFHLTTPRTPYGFASAYSGPIHIMPTKQRGGDICLLLVFCVGC